MAVSRRQKENDTFTDIALTLPIEESAKELDKASVLRIAIHYLKLRDVLTDCKPSISDGTEEDGVDEKAALQSMLPNYTKDVLQALDGFMLMLSKDGRILYATESISHFLGLRQVDVIGVHAQDIIHPQDYQEVNAIFQSQGRDVLEMDALGKDPMRRNFVARMRCAFTPSVRSITRCSNFKPIYCSAFLKFSSKKIKEGEFLGIVVLCKLASVMKIRELCVGAFFKTKHALDLSYTAVDTRIRWILGFDPAEMIGLKAYEYFHHEDLDATSSCHTHLLTKGYSHSCCYRFLSRSGDWVWVKSKSNVCYDPVTHLPNGLNVYTWIVRYEEEDERMKAILCGDDPGRLGVKELDSLSGVSSGVSGNIAELCSTRLKPNVISQQQPPVPTSSQQQSASAASTPVTSPPMYQPSSATTMNRSPVSPKLIAVPPPNVNPFQTPPAPSPMGTQLPLGAQAGHPASTCMQSPPYTPYESGPLASHIQPWQSSKQHYSSTSSSLGPHGSPPREMSPPYSANSSSSVVYNYPTPSASPGSASVQGNQAFSPGSATDLPSGYQHISQQPSPPMPYSDGVFSPYSVSSVQSFGHPINGFAAPSAFESMPAMTSYSAPAHPHHHVMHTQVKQEPRLEAVADVSHMPLSSHGQGYVYQAKARYTKVAVAGMGRHSSDARRHHHLHQLPQPQPQAFPDDPIQGISQWLQDSPAAVY